MAKQHDDRRRPDSNDPKSSKRSKPTPPIDDIEEAEVVDDEVEIVDDAIDVVDDDVEIVGEATPPPAKPAKPAKPAPPTTKIGKAPQQTKLARSPQPTKLAKKSPTPTMLGGDIDEDRPATPAGMKEPGQPAVPNLSLDDDADIVDADIVDADIVDADIVDADIVDADIVDADIVDADVVDADIVEAEEVAPAKPKKTPSPGDSVEIVNDELFAEEIPSKSATNLAAAAGIAKMDDDDIVEAEAVSGPGKKAPADDIHEDELLAELADSGPGKKPAPAGDDILDADEVLEAEDELEAAEVVSDAGQKSKKPADIVHEEVLGEDDVLDVADVVSGPGKKPAADDDDVFAAEEALEESSGKKLPAPKKSDLDFLADEQTLSDELAPDKAGKPTDDLERTAAFMPGDVEDKTEQMSAAEVFGDDSSALDSGTSKKSAGGERPSGVDALAEALESGVDVGKSDKSSKQQQPISEDDVDFSSIPDSDSTVNLGATPPPSKVKKQPADDDDVLTEALDEAEESGATSKPGKKKAMADLDAGDLITEEFADDEAPPPRGKKAPAKALDEDEEITEAVDDAEPVSGKRGGAAVATKKPPKPKYGRRWIGGMLLGWLLLGGALAGIWYFKQDLLEDGLAQVPASPNAAKDGILGNFKELKKAKADLPSVMKARSDAEEEVKKKTEALTKADATEKALRKNIDGLKETEKLAFQLRDFLKKDDVTEVPGAVEQLAKGKQMAEDLLKGMTKVLVESKAIDDKDKLDLDAFQKVVKDFSASRTTLEAINKKLEDANIKGDGEKGVGILVAAKKAVDDKLGAINKMLTEAMIKGDDVKGVKELVSVRKTLESDRNELEKSIQSAYKDLKAADPALAGEPRKVLNEAIKSLISKAQSPLAMPLSSAASALSGLATGAGKMIERGFDNSALLAELGFYRAREPFINTPGKQLDTWTALLKDSKFNDPRKLDSAIKEAAYVLSKEAKATPAERARALLLTGLALRNQEKFTEARNALEKAVKEAAAVEDAPELNKQIEQSLKELTDSAAFFLPQAARLQQKGDMDEAVKVIDTGLKAMPGDGRLLARRGLISLDKVRSLGKKIPAEVQKAIRADLDASRKDKIAAAEAYFILGQLDEAMEQWARAEDNYRLAIKHHLGTPEEASRYRIALARLLLLHDRPPSFPAEPEEKGKDVGARIVPAPTLARSASKGDEPSSLALRAQLVLAMIGVQADALGDDKKDDEPDPKKDKKKVDKKDKKGDDPKKDDEKKKDEPKDKKGDIEPKEKDGPDMKKFDDEETPEAIARLKESIALAKELIKSDDPKIKGQGHMILGQAYAKQGQRTKGLQEYVKGLRLLMPGTPSLDLDTMVKDHPAFQVPDTLARPNAFLAERQFGQGLHYYWSRQYAQAEEHFKAAIGFFNQDARYFYFLGLARFHQKDKRKSDAITFLEQGARLEAGNHPTSTEVNASLERIQGDLRAMVNSYRQKALLSAK